MEGIVILIIIFAVIFFYFANKPEKIEDKKFYQDIFDKHKVYDYKYNDYIIKSIKYSLHHEIFEYNKVEFEPEFPTFFHAIKYGEFLHTIYNDGISIDDIITRLINEYPDDKFNDFIFNEIHDLLSNYRKEITEFLNNETLCTNFLIETGFIVEENFNVEGASITAYRTLLNDSITFKHPGTNKSITNFQFKIESKNEIVYHNSAVDYFEQILIKIIKHNTEYLHQNMENIFEGILTVNSPDSVGNEIKIHELITRINYVLNNKIIKSIPSNYFPNFLSLKYDFYSVQWYSTRKELLNCIDKYNLLVKAYQTSDLKTQNESLCFFERNNFLLSADTISLVSAISDFKNVLTNRLDELEYSITGKIDDVQSDMESKLNEVQSSANKAAMASTIAAVQSTRALRRLKK